VVSLCLGLGRQFRQHGKTGSRVNAMPGTRLGQAVKTALIAFAFFTIVPNLVGHSWLAWYKMSKTGQWTEAVITKIEPENHQGCGYEFVVNAQKYTGWDSGCASYGVGSSIKIMYLPDKPSFSTTRNPGGELMFVVLAPFLMSVIGGIMVYVANRENLS
jgi:hypothetical protein